MITIFTKNDCQPCRLTKDFMKRHEIEYEERNIEDDESAYAEVVALGYNSVPVVRTPSGFHWNGLRPDFLKDLTAAMSV